MQSTDNGYQYLDEAEERRLAAVRRYQILDRPLASEYQRIAFVAATLFDTPIATVSIVDADRVWLAACQGLTGVRQVGREPGLCASVIARDDVYVVTDAVHDARTLEHPLVRGELGLRFYAAAPIRTRDGYRLGTVNVIDQQPREPESRQLEALECLAGIVSDELEMRLVAVEAAVTDRRWANT